MLKKPIVGAVLQLYKEIWKYAFLVSRYSIGNRFWKNR